MFWYKKDVLGMPWRSMCLLPFSVACICLIVETWLVGGNQKVKKMGTNLFSLMNERWEQRKKKKMLFAGASYCLVAITVQ